MPKYRDIFRSIMKEHEDLFANFAQVHAAYSDNAKENQAVFNKVGEQVVELLRDGERTLCGKTEKGNNAVFSAKLADKYWKEVKAFFPLIDFVGAKIS